MTNENSSSFEAQIQDVFLTEAEEMLESSEAIFLKLETNPQDLSKIDSIFRIVHTIKGSAHIAGFAELGNFAHKLETLLNGLRDKKLVVSSEIIEILLASNDLLVNHVKSLRLDTGAKLDDADLGNRIVACLQIKSGTQISESAVQREPAPLVMPVDIGSKNKAATSKQNILICDDEPGILDVLGALIEEAGYCPITAENATIALEILKTVPIDVIFTDYMMPNMTGIQFIEIVRSFNLFLPVVFVSGNYEKEQTAQFMHLGVFDFVDKPFNDERIIFTAKRAIAAKAMHDSILSLSRLSYRAFIAIQRLKSLLTSRANESLIQQENALLSITMDQLQLTTKAILAAEKGQKAS